MAFAFRGTALLVSYLTGTLDWYPHGIVDVLEGVAYFGWDVVVLAIYFVAVFYIVIYPVILLVTWVRGRRRPRGDAPSALPASADDRSS